VAEAWILLAACGLATYAFRGFGALLSGSLRAEGEAFAWVSCVAFAMIAGLIARMLLMPTGVLAEITPAERAIGTGVALAAYFALTRRNLFAGVFAGALAVWLLRLAAG
jgi:branched-subunit amino acid transport protein